MCFELDSEPPIPRISGAAVSHEDLVLESEDGNRFAAFRALPEEVLQLSTGIVILPDVRGLYRFYEELALRFAERGFGALAFDYFGRTAEFEQALSDAGKEYELIEFEGAPHSFFDRKQEEFQEASDDAWRRTLEFIEKHS